MKRTPPYFYMRYYFILLLFFLSSCNSPVYKDAVNPLTGLSSDAGRIVTGVYSQPLATEVLIEIPLENDVIYLAASLSDLPDNTITPPPICDMLISGFHNMDSPLFDFQNLNPFERESTSFRINDHIFTYDHGLYENHWTNIILLEVETFYDSSQTWYMDTNGGTGYYFCNGTHQEIRWQKLTSQHPIALWDTTGKSLAVQPGRTFIIFAQYDVFLDPEE